MDDIEGYSDEEAIEWLEVEFGKIERKVIALEQEIAEWELGIVRGSAVCY